MWQIQCVKLFSLTFILFVLPIYVEAQFNLGFLTPERPTVNTTGGQIQGIQIFRDFGTYSYFAFRGIPYAQPPVGNLRWRNPRPHTGWTGVRDGSKFGARCPNENGIYIGNFSIMGLADSGGYEDCLFLNVYTEDVNASRPVMVWIHGGAFIGGSGESWRFGPSYLLREGVVVVSINYRLGVLGFLATGDAAAQGNWGLKDQVEALRWVQKNIARFGGNPNEVTIFGESAGSVSVNYQIISKMRGNLFKRAITQSGAALNGWSFQPRPLREAAKVAAKLKIRWRNTQELVDKLRKVPFGDLVNNAPATLEAPRAVTSFGWSPVKEQKGSKEPMFIDRAPEFLYRSGSFKGIPLMTGSNSAESVFCTFEQLIDPKLFDKYKANPQFYAPIAFRLNESSTEEYNEIATKFKEIYFGGEEPSIWKLNEWVQFQSDSMFNYGIDRTTRYIAAKGQPLYYYTFSKTGSLNVVKNYAALGFFPGAMHTDELFHLFDPEDYPVPILADGEATQTRKQMVRMWTNFAKFGNPTPTTDDLITVKWPAYTLAGEEYLDIDKQLTPMNKRFGGRLDAWHDFWKRFAP